MPEKLHLRKGFVHVYTGNGKGKTSSALGLCLRAVGRGLNCIFIQFCKERETGERLVSVPNLKFVKVKDPKRGLELAKKSFKDYDIVVLDELNLAIHKNLIDIKEVLNLLKEKPETVEVVITGRYAKKEIVEVADYVVYFQMLKHPFYKGITARKGIEW